MMNYQIHKMGIWCGALFALFLGLGYVLIPWFELLPPFAPTLTRDELFVILDDNRIALKAGMTIIFNMNLFLIPFVATFAAQIRRMEGELPVFSDVVRIAGAVAAISGCIPAGVFMTLLYRPDIDPDVLYMLNDMFWIFFVGWVSPLMFVTGPMGIVILSQPEEEAVYPRWFGYWCLWEMLILVGGGFIIFFTDGPFAWDGLLAFWLPLVTIFAWFIAVAVLTYINILEQEAAIN